MADSKISTWNRQIATLTSQMHAKADEQRELQRRIAKLDEALDVLRDAHRLAGDLSTSIRSMRFNETWTGRVKRELESNHGNIKNCASDYKGEIWSCILAVGVQKAALMTQYDVLGAAICKAEDSVTKLRKNIASRRTELDAAARRAR